ncbi:MAG: FmdB family zinc ribbon protein [Dehalococcoidia bacterium]
MPTYVYRCSVCGNQYEKRESFSAPNTQACEKCGEIARRVPVVSAVIFKGTGFHRTEGRTGSNDGEAPARAPAPAPSTTSASSESGSSSSDGAGTTDSPKPAPAPATSDEGHGHSHGPGGHTH